MTDSVFSDKDLSSEHNIHPPHTLVSSVCAPLHTLSISCFIVVYCIVFFVFLGPHPQRMEVPRLGGQSELQQPAYTTTTAMRNPNHICDLHHSSWQHWIFNPLSKAGDWIHILMNTSRVCYHWATTGSPDVFLVWGGKNALWERRKII